ncbi:hypothetical protein [Pseudonocardia alni]|uniref:hypothetical protein n=1 Tax=Pseudonocardia alni TaxID=33907 RepID=UPI00279DAF15|nr:hypothetical protein PaSha_12720 [Pseudonocardia alni]
MRPAYRRPQVTEADVVALETYLRDLLAAGAASEDEIARYERERDRLLDGIGAQMRAQRDHDRAMRALRAEMGAAAPADGRLDDGHDAARPAHLDAAAVAEEDQQTEFRRIEAMTNAPYRAASADEFGLADDEADRYRWGDRTEVVEATARDDAERSDRDRVLDEGPGSFVDGMWFTPDDTADDGVRPLTDAELRRMGDLVRATQAEAVADRITDDERPPARAPEPDDDGTEWTR